MKYTGWAVLVIGVLIGVYGLFTMFPTDPAQVPPAQTAEAPPPLPVPLGGFLLGFAALAVGAGLTMLLYGGRGVIKTRNPAVRN
jgi:hypothetical protein